jgi:serine/threonine protein kinase
MLQFEVDRFVMPPAEEAPAKKAPKPHSLGKYRLVERLGRGGMAEVWLAKIMGPGGFQRTLVVKRILPHLAEDPHFVKMFLAEARLSARLNHPNIVAVHELGEVDGEYFIAMEFVNGRDLVTVLRTMLPLGLPEPGLGAFVVRDTARALGYAHSLRDENRQPLRIIHRDVSPSNVMVSFDGAVKLVDFGLAKALSDSNDEHTKTGTLKGKFGYMAPEQITAVPVDHRIDVWATGVVLWESLTGRRLFRAQSDMATIALVREGRIDPPSTQNPSVTPRLDAIVAKALERDRDKRYQTCEELAQDLDDAVAELRWGPERLAGMMREMFPDQQNASDRAALPDLPDSVASSPASTQPRVQSATVRRPPKQRWIYGVIGGVVAIGVTTTAIVVSRGQPHPPPQVIATPPPAKPSAPARVEVLIDSRPSGARVFVDDEHDPRGVTPMDLTLQRSELTRTVRLALDGYQEQSAPVRADRDGQLLLTLVERPVEKPVASSSSKHRPKKSGSASSTVTGTPDPTPQPASDLSRGDVVDPFK